MCLVRCVGWVVLCGGRDVIAEAATSSVPSAFGITGWPPPYHHPRPPTLHAPRFNVEEFLDLEKIDRGVPTIIVNGNLDRVRSGYYPRYVVACFSADRRSSVMNKRDATSMRAEIMYPSAGQ